jgi:N-acetylmuramoyl-L-alanine amidase
MQIDKSKKFLQFFEAKKEPRKIDFLVLHHVKANSAEHAIEQFCEHQVSSHFLIDEQGNIFELVGENDVAFHAGISFWKGVEGLNQNSIGVEFISSSPFSKKFEAAQMLAGAQLCKYLIAKYQIAAGNVVGHSDIGYVKETGILDRKQDPSHLFDWKFLAENGVGIFPSLKSNFSQDESLFQIGNKDIKIVSIKENLKKFGYRVINLNEEFDQEMQALVRVFNRRFNGKDLDVWCSTSQNILEKLCEQN